MIEDLRIALEKYLQVDPDRSLAALVRAEKWTPSDYVALNRWMRRQKPKSGRSPYGASAEIRYRLAKAIGYKGSYLSAKETKTINNWVRELALLLGP